MSITEHQAYKQFPEDILSHEMTIAHDDVPYRHIHFKRPKSGIFGTNIMTWPGHLAISGDMGHYIFTCEFDMFDFFDMSTFDGRPRLGYWAEKVRAVDRFSSIKEVSSETFTHELQRWAHSYCRDLSWKETKDFLDELRELVSNECSSFVHEPEDIWHIHFDDAEIHGVLAAIHQQFDSTVGGFIDPTDYTYRYVWCCLAIVEIINRYDKLKKDTI